MMLNECLGSSKSILAQDLSCNDTSSAANCGYLDLHNTSFAITSGPDAELPLPTNPRSCSKPVWNAALDTLDPFTLMLIAVVESQGSQAWVLLAVGEAFLVSTLEEARQGSLGEAFLGASAQQPDSDSY